MTLYRILGRSRPSRYARTSGEESKVVDFDCDVAGGVRKRRIAPIVVIMALIRTRGDKYFARVLLMKLTEKCPILKM